MTNPKVGELYLWLCAKEKGETLTDVEKRMLQACRRLVGLHAAVVEVAEGDRP